MNVKLTDIPAYDTVSWRDKIVYISTEKDNI